MKNVSNTYFSTVFKKAVKNVLDRQTLCFTVANFVHYEKQYTFSKNSNETRRICGALAAPDFANSGKRHVHFHYVNSDSREKCIGSPNPLFYHCKLLFDETQYTFSKNSNETRRICGALAAPDFANSGQKTYAFSL